MNETHDTAPHDGIAVVGMACRYPDADDPAQLWDLVLRKRRAFRRLPAERLAVEDYADPTRRDPDSIYGTRAALLEGWHFDRSAFRVPGAVHRATDPAHWLALETAARALEDAGVPGGAGLDRDRVAVVMGNTLTGEVTRARTMRLRWPYVRAVLDAVLAEEGLTGTQREKVLARTAERYLEPFPAPDDEFLAGGLANTIAGRICNQFDFHGGGFTVDGACASSLLAVTTACGRLREGSADLVLAGGVDISLDPFELVGFARLGALAEDRMRIYDKEATGFLPGEGCGVVALMRGRDAAAAGIPVYAEIRGWGISSDGAGGITRPDRRGQLLALRRAYAHAGVDPAATGLVEGHGTGTAVGDAIELQALCALRAGSARPAALGSVKANIGHTKAAAGLAGLIKACLSVHGGVLPPTTGCDSPRDELAGEDAVLRILADAAEWPPGPRVAGVSAFGFGGINTHVVLGEPRHPGPRVTALPALPRARRADPEQELILLSSDSPEELSDRLRRLSRLAPRLCDAELHDLACAWGREPHPGSVRAALIAASPEQLARRAEAAADALAETAPGTLARRPGVWAANACPGRVTLLFPGQGAPLPAGPGAIGADLAEDGASGFPGASGPRPVTGTAAAQAVVHRASLTGLRWLERLGVRAEAALGHSLGEYAALVWAGCLGVRESLDLVDRRGRTMAELCAPGTGMLALTADVAVVEELCRGTSLTVAAYNGPLAQVVAGPAGALAALARRAAERGIDARPLPVAHAFHSPAVAAAAEEFAPLVRATAFAAPRGTLLSGVSGGVCRTGGRELRELLCAQMTAPVRFWEAVRTAADRTDLFCEAGPGRALAALAAPSGVPTVSLDVGAPGPGPRAQTAAALFACGALASAEALFEGRESRPVDPWRERVFIGNPCARPASGTGTAPAGPAAPATSAGSAGPAGRAVSAERAVRAERAVPAQLSAPAEPFALVPAERSAPAGPAGRAEAVGAVVPAERPARAEPFASVVPDEPVVRPAGEDIADIVVRLAARATEFDPEALTPDQRLLSDLHLSSLKVTQMVAEAARAAGREPPAAPLTLADASLAEIIEVVRALPGAGSGDEPEAIVTGIAPWIRCFAEQLRPVAPPAPDPADRPGRITVAAPPGAAPGADALRPPPGEPTGRAELLYVPDAEAPEGLAGILGAARAALAGDGRLVLVTHGSGLSGFAGSLHQEHPELGITVLRVPPTEAGLAAAAAVAGAEPGVLRELVVREDGTCAEPVAVPLPEPAAAEPVLGPGDVLLVSGGGKGLGFEAAAAFARTTGVPLALLGRADPARDTVLRRNLERLAELGTTVRYQRADVTDPHATAHAVAEVERELGPVTAVLHASGINRPRRFDDLTEADVRAHLAPKTSGLAHLLAAVDRGRLRLLIGFGSVIGRYGLAGECHYALANGRLRQMLQDEARHLPGCRTLVLDWSVWASVGMGERLGVLDQLARKDVTPIPVERGLDLLLRLAAAPGLPTAVTVHGRMGLPPRPLPADACGPAARFLTRPRIHYPGVELVVDNVLTEATDPYLRDHRVDGLPVLPAVVGLEAMAQAASVLAGRPLRRCREVTFDQPVTPAAGAPRVLRLCALAEDGAVTVALRSDETAFGADHFRAVFPLPDGAEPADAPSLSPVTGDDPEVLAADLYGPLYFHTGRFRRVERLGGLRARQVRARLGTAVEAGWFARGLAQGLLLGSPGRNDATIHALQACVPGRRLLPVGCEEFQAAGQVPAGADGDVTVHARELWCGGGAYEWDVEAVDTDGRVLVRWHRLRLLDVGRLPRRERWIRPLLAVHLERGALALGLDPALTLGIESGAPRERTVPPVRPPHGTSRSHCGPLTLTATAPGGVAVDWQRIAPAEADGVRSALGPPYEGLWTQLRLALDEPDHAIAARLWAVAECGGKAGYGPTAPVTVDGVFEDGWVRFRSGRSLVATTVVPDRLAPEGVPEPEPGTGDGPGPVIAVAVMTGAGGTHVAARHVQPPASGDAGGDEPRRERVLQ
ncbi:type I polyketide synthase [Streptomyces griseochromogenes]|uniref:type I polyketide synthase n=1 Tax=Streptomyces griseochromogenes TaxID=68214 RepID=UPI0013318DA7|nr:type I polyketide synthase [Streptomyces griseochromogenes]